MGGVISSVELLRRSPTERRTLGSLLSDLVLMSSRFSSAIEKIYMCVCVCMQSKVRKIAAKL